MHCSKYNPTPTYGISIVEIISCENKKEVISTILKGTEGNYVG